MVAASAAFISVQGSFVKGETLIVPVVTLSERYDSNVFNSPKIAGVNREDWVSTVIPQLNVMHRGSAAQTILQLTGIGERYVNNSGLSYFGGGANLAMNLNRLVQEYNPRLSLTLSNGTFYTPQAPAFSPPNPDLDPNVFARGIQIVRVNTFTNASSATATYRLMPTTSLRVSYTYNVIRFGSSFVNIGNAGLINTNTQSINAGPQFQLTERDTMSINYLYQRSDFVGGQLPGFPSKFETHGGTVGWMRGWNRELRTNLFIGATQVDEGAAVVASGVGSGTQTSTGTLIVYTGGASLIYTDLAPQATGTGTAGLGGGGLVGGFGGGFSMPGSGAMGMTGGASKIMVLNYSTGVFPSFYSGGVPLINHLVSGSIFKRIGSSWATTVGGDYAKSESLSKQASAADLQFQSYGGYASISLFLTPTMFASISGDYHKFEGQGLALSGALAGGTTAFDRYTGMISLTKLWY